MAIRTVDAEWRGNLAQDSGRMQLGSGAFEGSYDFRSRLDDGNGTSPEELLGAAHAGCFSMALQLTNAGFPVKHIHKQRMHISKSVPAGCPSTESISKRKRRSRMSQRWPSRNMRRMPRGTAQFRELCPASTSICEPSSSELSASISRESTFFVCNAGPVVTTE
jgi:organic hydroperoxide reductase OsmC/OhrA